MEFQRKKVAAAIGYALGAGGIAAVVAGPALAQDVRVEVTGSNIKRVESEGALPVQVVTKTEIEREGIVTTEGLVARLSANASIGGLGSAGSEGGFNVGYTSASLRGLGGSRTLVLLNGRRMSNTAFSGTSVDLNSIPLAAIERVEILTDGASAIYGTDAIAGVINFILRKDFTGFEGMAYYGDSEQGGGSQQHYNIAGGWGDLAKDKFNIFATVDYQKLERIKAADREFSKTAYLPFAPGGNFDRTSGNSIPGNVFLPSTGQTISPGLPGCLPPYSFPTLSASGRTQCRFDFASVIDIVPDQEMWNVLGSAKWQFLPDHQAFIDASWAQNKTTTRISPAPVSSATLLSGDPVLTIPGTPYYPTAFAIANGVNGQPLEVFWRSLELGPRTDNITTEQSRVVGGVQGTIAKWDYSAAVNWSQSKAWDEWPEGWSIGSALLPILNSGQINLFGFNTPQAIALLKTAGATGKVTEAKGTSTDFELKASSDIYNLPAGPLALALGGNYRKEEYEFTASDIISGGDVLGLGGSTPTLPKVTRNVWDLFGELNIPIVKTLEANIAVRYDDYEDVGSTTNPKVSLRWQPTRELLFRGSYGKGFRAPSLIELFQPFQFGATGGQYDDPKRCAQTGSPRDCNTQFTTRGGGNPDLKPEKSTQWSLGGIVEPVPGFSLGADYWNIEIKDVIGQPSEDAIFGDINASEAAGLIVRYAPGSPGCQNAGAGLPCPINFGIQGQVNLTKLDVSGVDVNLGARLPRQNWGSIDVKFNGTYYIKWNQQNVGEDEVHLAGKFAGNAATVVSQGASAGAVPRWKHNWAGNYNYGPWQATLSQTYQNGYVDDGDARRVGSYSLWALAGGYTGVKNLTLQLGIKNLFDRDPPFTRQGNTFQVGYDPAYADPVGRFFWGSIKYAFK